MGTNATAAILGLGSYTPEKRLTNEDFSKSLDTSDEWITTRTGIKTRHIAAQEQATSDLCLHAAQDALEDAGIAAEELDLILIATLTPDYVMPSTACLLQKKLGLAEKGTAALDVNAACSGFLYGLATAKAYVEAGLARRVLLLGAEVLSRVVDYRDRATCILFGDAAGAVVIGPHRTDGASHPIREVKLWADGRYAESLIIPAGGSKLPASQHTVDEQLHFLRVNGREVFRLAVTKVVAMIRDLMERHRLTREEIGKIVPHQANYRILESASERLGMPMDLFVTNLAEYGNTSAASVPLALSEAYRAGQFPAGKHVLLTAFGAGLTWASALIEW